MALLAFASASTDLSVILLPSMLRNASEVSDGRIENKAMAPSSSMTLSALHHVLDALESHARTLYSQSEEMSLANDGSDDRTDRRTG